MEKEKQLIDVSVARGYAESLIADPILKMAVYAVLNNTPRVDANPVVHARWERCFEDWRHQIEGNQCSACGFQHYGDGIRHYHYCPNCGATMDGEPKDDGRPAV